MRFWLALAALVVGGAVLVATLSDTAARPLDPTSTAGDGSRALVRVLEGYGVRVTTSRAASVALGGATAVVVVDPAAYSTAQLRRIAAGAGRTVLVAPDVRSLRALGLRAEPDSSRLPSSTPGCSDAGARAAGELAVPDDAVAYDGLPVSCYGGFAGFDGRVAVLGSSTVLQNSTLAADGVAALSVNMITADRTLRQAIWLLPGADAEGSGPLSVWDLFPSGVHRAFVWTLVLGGLVVLWRARRLGGVVREPLPVEVRAAEVVEGQGRLYERAGARDRAAWALREAALARLRRQLSLARTAPAEEVAARIGTAPAGVLTGPLPASDAALLRFAQELDGLEEGITRG